MGKTKEIWISSDSHETRVAVTEDKRLEEFYVERTSDQRVVGSIYKGRITSVVPGIGACPPIIPTGPTARATKS